jgi:hypothetical protein
MRTGATYAKRLARLRRSEAKRVLAICRQYDDFEDWPSVIQTNLDESGYWGGWVSGLYLNVGLPHARSITRDLTRAKASAPGDVWVQALKNYAATRAGEEISIVSGTFKNDLVDILRTILEEEVEMGIEKLTKTILREYDALAPWQIRRISQTETMVGMAEAGSLAASSLDIGFTKQWCCSGLANTRETHLVMDGAVVDQNEYFELPDCRMLYPHDTSLNPRPGKSSTAPATSSADRNEKKNEKSFFFFVISENILENPWIYQIMYLSLYPERN